MKKVIIKLVLAANVGAFDLTELIEEENRISSASMFLEKESEAPAVVDTVSGDEIKRYGYRNLYDILSYQPGFFIVQDANEKIYSHRGMFATGTQKLLFTREGFRMNNTLFNSVTLDNSISLNSIDNIEVLRGAAGSLYGDTSLTGVVSINGRSVNAEDTTEVTFAAGSFGAVSADLFAKQGGLSVWGYYFDNDGEEVDVDSEDDYAINAIDGQETINKTEGNGEFGVKYEDEFSKWYFSHRKNRYANPRANGGQLLASEDLAPMELYQETQDTHASITLKPIYHDLFLELNHYYDRFTLETPQVAAVVRDGSYVGVNIEAQSESYGIDYKAKSFSEDSTFLIGFKAENNNYNRLDISKTVGTAVTTAQLPSESEMRFALYAQEKYHLSEKVIINGGVRLDSYETVGEHLSPRVALNYSVDEESTVKLIYSHSFLSPIYFYRNNNSDLGYGSDGDLKPEQADNYQLSYQTGVGSYYSRATIYYTDFKDIVVKEGTIYNNAEEYAIQGFEGELKFKDISAFEWFVNYSYNKVVHGSASTVDDGEIVGYPSSMLKGGLSYLANRALSLYVSPTAQWIDQTTNPNGESNPSYMVANLNLYAPMNNNFEWSVGIFNLLDEEYALGGSVDPYSQHGRNFMAKATVRF